LELGKKKIFRDQRWIKTKLPRVLNQTLERQTGTTMMKTCSDKPFGAKPGA